MLEGYIVDEMANPTGTSLKSHIKARYRDLERILGKPEESAEDKVSGSWTIVSEDGDVITLYDWKSTNRYAEGLPSVEAFRSSPIPQEFNIGARSLMVALEFKEALEKELARAGVSAALAKAGIKVNDYQISAKDLQLAKKIVMAAHVRNTPPKKK